MHIEIKKIEEGEKSGVFEMNSPNPDLTQVKVYHVAGCISLLFSWLSRQESSE